MFVPAWLGCFPRLCLLILDTIMSEDTQNDAQSLINLSNVIYALALTSGLATFLFLLVAINGKEAFGTEPFTYAAICLVLTLLLSLLRLPIDPQRGS